MGLGRQWEERLKLWDDAFDINLYQKLEVVELEGFVTMDHIPLCEVRKREFWPFKEGKCWGRKWEYGWFRCRIILPGQAAGRRVILKLGAASEMLVYVNGREAGSIDRQHDFVQLTSAGVPGEKFEVYAEGYAGHGPRLENGGIYPPESIPIPQPPKFQCVVKESSFGLWNEEMFQAYADYHTLYELMRALPENSLRRMQVACALKEFTYQADFELPEPLRTESVKSARGVLAPLLDKKNGSSVPLFSVVGQSHLDLAWLWTREETKRKSARTYANQLALMERYKEYRFLLCEPPILENLKQYYPDLYLRVKERVREGRFIPDGAMWVEGDVNMAGGESLIRQFVYGKRWFYKEFGVDSRVAWMPDTFGFTGALPQIMKGCGVDFFATQKLLRADPECEPFPYNLFWWEGIDGSRILTHIFKKNNAAFSPADMVARWEKDRNQEEEISGMLYPFGYGDGGGGPTELMLEMLCRCGDLEGAPRTVVEGPGDYFSREGEQPVENVYYGELYLAWHRGTYTAQALIKKKVREAEGALRQAEFLAGLCRLSGREPGDFLEDISGREISVRVEALWKELLFCEFHDILPGTSIKRVNEEAKETLSAVRQEASLLADKLLSALAGEGAVFNSLSFKRRYRGEYLPPCGYIRTGQCTGQEDEKKALSVSALFSDDKKNVLVESPYYRAKVDCIGRILSLTDKESGYEYAAGALNELCLYRDVNVDYDAWELGRMYEKVPEKLLQEGTLAIRRERDGVHLDIDRREANFTWQQEIVFAKDQRRIEFHTKVDWRERHKILKVSFPTAVYTREAIEEIQFGYLKRPTHRSRRYERDLYETCHHRYAVLCDGRNGFALLNNCKYGISAKDSTLSLTLLRAPVIPDMEADQGEHEFAYALYLFQGSFTGSNVVREAYELNTDVLVSGGLVRDIREAGEAVSYFSIDESNIILENCKPALDSEDAVVLRLYECMGGAVTCVLSLPPAVKEVWICNMLEEKQEKVPLTDGKVRLFFHSFEIRTLMLFV